MLRAENEVVVASCTQIGKTFACAAWLIAWLWQHPRALGWWVAPTYLQVEQGYGELKRFAEAAGILVHSVDHKYRLYLLNGSRIQCRSWEKDKYLQGPTVHAMVVDEAGLLTSSARAILATRRSATLGPVRYIGNPGPTLGEFWNLCQQAEDPENAGRIRFIKWTWKDRYLALRGEHPLGDTPASLKDVARAEDYRRFVEDQRRDMAPFEFARWFEAEFQSPERAIFAPWVDAVTLLDPDPNPHPGHPYVVGWDVGQAESFTVGIPLCLKCWQAHYMLRIRRRSYTSIEEIIAEESRRFNEATAVIEVNGPGGPVADGVQKLYEKVQRWTTTTDNKRSAVLELNRKGTNGAIRLAKLPPLQSEMKAFESQQSPKTNAWTFGPPKGTKADTVMSLVIAVGAATSGARAFIQMWRDEADRLEAEKKKAGAAG